MNAKQTAEELAVYLRMNEPDLDRDAEKLLVALTAYGDQRAAEAQHVVQDIDWEEVTKVINDAISNGDGFLGAAQLEYQFMKAGLGLFRLPDNPKTVAEVAAEARREALEEAASVAVRQMETNGLDGERLYDKIRALFSQPASNNSTVSRTLAAATSASDLAEDSTCSCKANREATPGVDNQPAPKQNDDRPSYDDLMKALYIYQERTGQSLEDTLAGKWTNPPARQNDDGMTLPVLPDEWNLETLGHWCDPFSRWECHIMSIDQRSINSEGPTPRAAVLAAIAKIQPTEGDGK